VDGWFEPRLAGRVGLPDPNNFYWPAAMPAIAKHYGVSFDDPQQLIDRFKRVKVQGFYTSSSDAQSSLQSGDVWLTPLTDGRCIGLQLGKQPVTFVPLNLTIDGKKYPYVGLEDVWDIAKGSDNYDLAVKFIDMMLGPDGTLPLTRKFGYIPSRQDLQAQAAQLPDLKAYLAGFSYDQLYFPDYKIFFPHLRDWNDAWNHTFRN
jgi:spermidine/putrescine-binding protein